MLSLVEVKALQTAAHNALAFYESNVPEQLKQKPYQPNDNLYINYAELIVDKSVEFLFGNGLEITIGSNDETTGEDYLKTIWDVTLKKSPQIFDNHWECRPIGL